MSEKKLCRSRYVENFIPPDLNEKLVHEVCESVADVFLSQIEYGNDYIISTELVKEDWADGFGTKYTYNLKFDELVRCRDCRFAYPLFDEEGDEIQNMFDCHGELTSPWDFYNDEPQDNPVESDGFCKWGERKEND